MLLGTWPMVGLAVDGWADDNLAQLEAFFTLRHALPASGFVARGRRPSARAFRLFELAAPAAFWGLYTGAAAIRERIAGRSRSRPASDLVRYHRAGPEHSHEPDDGTDRR